jgi:hypothetical protein
VRQAEPVPHTLRYAVGDNRLDITLDDGETSSLWWATKNEWLGLVDVAGLELEALYGGFDRKPLDDESREYVFVARRPGRGPFRAAPGRTTLVSTSGPTDKRITCTTR